MIALLLGPTPAIDATSRCERLLEEVSDEPRLKAQIHGAMAPLLLMQGRSAEADGAMTMARAAMEDADEWIWIVSFWLAFVHLWRDDPEAAERELRPGYDALSTIGEKSHYSSIAHGLSQALYLQGRYDECLELTRECELASRPNDVHSQVTWRSIRAKLLARRGEHEAAADLCDEALSIASSSDFLVAHADALADRAEVARLAGDHALARRSDARRDRVLPPQGQRLRSRPLRPRERLIPARDAGTHRLHHRLTRQGRVDVPCA